MQLGFVSAILPEQSLEEVFRIAASIGYDCVEVMCWPRGKAERRYAGVTHIDVTEFTPARAADIRALSEKYGVAISGLGYYPNPLVADAEEGQVYIDHIRAVIDAAATLGLDRVNTFIGRDPKKSVEDNWPRFLEVWKPLVEHAESRGVKIGIENCPMLFTNDEWPGGKNLATTPAIWTKMFADLDSDHIGLNYDPSHLIWQHMDYLAPMRDFSDRLFHVHAKDVRVDQHKLNQHGIMAPPNLWHEPKLPGMGGVDWGQFFSILTSAGYDGPVCVEVEDRAYEGSLDKRIAALRQSHNYLKQFMGV
ncbi:sugar phosphate isomerase/epimerase [Lewinella sp. W8]|uniref:sugar phosphate isomerase/epimerase family protein n=1 Tax=Lewinella sp. W8 TaxID=2528208 RepID=UPI001067538D|nr:sugar phosphate isomerase/epimerase family protein [Lewinella sp. W8]MTB52415.1 TIM barrel protein [Lewinella sp. W8]